MELLKITTYVDKIAKIKKTETIIKANKGLVILVAGITLACFGAYLARKYLGPEKKPKKSIFDTCCYGHSSFGRQPTQMPENQQISGQNTSGGEISGQTNSVLVPPTLQPSISTNKPAGNTGLLKYTALIKETAPYN